MLAVLDTTVAIICFCILIISLLIIINQNRKIENLESIIYYYKWHGALFDYPHSSGWYLVQTDDNEKKIKVLFYNIEKNNWDYFGKNKIISWCHLPNYLYPQNGKVY